MVRVIFLTNFLLFTSCFINNYNEKTPCITLQTTACMGSCPVYNINIYKDGQAIFKGIKNTEIHGTHVLMISKKEQNQIINTAKKMNFSKVPEKKYYDNFIKDLPSTKIQMLNHNIIYNQSTPSLNKLKQLIYDIIIKKIITD